MILKKLTTGTIILLLSCSGALITTSAQACACGPDPIETPPPPPPPPPPVIEKPSITLNQQLEGFSPNQPSNSERVFLLEEGSDYQTGGGNNGGRPMSDRVYSRIFPASGLSQ